VRTDEIVEQIGVFGPFFPLSTRLRGESVGVRRGR
jgi:hypothetical protein